MPTPIHFPGRPWSIWFKPTIYTGPLGTGAFVPNVEDAVWSWEEGIFRVVAVHPTTFESTLDRTNIASMGGGVLAEDILLGTGPGTVSEPFRIYINTLSTPFRLDFDNRLICYGSETHHIKVFRGTDISSLTGHVISAMYNLSNVYIGEDIPMETIVDASNPSTAMQRPVAAWSTEALNDGDVVTAVSYAIDNRQLSSSVMLVVNSDFVHTNDLSRRYVIGIELNTPFMSLVDDHLIECPYNLPLQSLSFTANVRYSNGDVENDLPITGTRFQLLGLNAFLPTQGGQSATVFLKYILQPNEYGYGVSAPLPERFMLEEYQITTLEAQGMYTVKLFVSPKWSSALGKWELDYYMYDLDRQSVRLVTSLVEYSTETGAFDGTLLNAPQRIKVGINLNAVDPMYLIYRHVQAFYIELKNSGANTVATNYCTLQYSENTFFGSGLYAVVSPDLDNPLNKRLNVSFNLADVDDWLTVIYKPTLPLLVPHVELEPVVPTHVRVKVGASFVRELEVWQALDYINAITVPIIQGDTVRLEFFQRTFEGDFELGLSALNVRI